MTSPQKYEIKYTKVGELFYSTKTDELPNSNVVNTLTEPLTIKDDSSRSLRSSFSSGFEDLDGKYNNISYSGIRIPDLNPLSGVKATFKETFVINTLEGSLTGTAVYNDEGSTDITTVASTIWAAKGTGKYQDVNLVKIMYDNDSSKFGYVNSRKIAAFKAEKMYL